MGIFANVIKFSINYVMYFECFRLQGKIYKKYCNNITEQKVSRHSYPELSKEM